LGRDLEEASAYRGLDAVVAGLDVDGSGGEGCHHGLMVGEDSYLPFHGPGHHELGLAGPQHGLRGDHVDLHGGRGDYH